MPLSDKRLAEIEATVGLASLRAADVHASGEYRRWDAARAACVDLAGELLAEVRRLRGVPAAIVGAIEREAEKWLESSRDRIYGEETRARFAVRAETLAFAAQVARKAIDAPVAPPVAEVPGDAP